MRDDNNAPKKKLTASWWFKSLAVAVPTVVIAVSASKLMNSPLPDTPAPDTDNNSVSDEYRSDAPDIDPNAGEYVEPEKEDNSSKGISIPGWNSLSIPKNKKDVSVDFFNPEENEGMYHLTFELRIPDESEQGYEVLYKSGLVDPGLHIQNITLSHELEAGTYDATIHVQPYRMDEQKTATNNADMQTQLIVE
ncbi:MAG: hypothetical protein NC340_06885 [Ruminococcus flavefaciens]|nr:hypothetical protein [Ruminococcus flavefaciens]MCM1230419.1 hypothetical protein [Ruminococcus flavefaciens]